MTFEENLKLLQETVKALESGEKSLEESLELFKKGIEYSASCKKELENARLTVEMLDKND